MKRIILKCERNNHLIDSKLGVFFHAWLMDQFDESVANTLHENHLHPFSTYINYDNNYVNFVISLLIEKETQSIEDILLKNNINQITLHNNCNFNIIDKQIYQCTEQDLAHLFYECDANRYITVNFITPTAFKTNGIYLFYPDLRLLFHSLLMKYNFIFEGNQHVDNDLLEQFYNKINIINYNLHSYHYPIHNIYIPAFKGRITLHCHGSQTLTNYLNMLLHFGEYSGVGVKTAMGMGHIEIFNKESSNNAKK